VQEQMLYRDKAGDAWKLCWIESWNSAIVCSMRKWARPAFGTGMCTATAGFVTLMFRGSSFKTILPILFLAIIVFCAVRFGRVAGLLGTVIAARIFAVFLFEPTPSLGVADPAQRSNLIWMIVGGIAMSELLGNHRQQRPQSS
jgi:K+-sensing histidine kinase KdpD